MTEHRDMTEPESFAVVSPEATGLVRNRPRLPLDVRRAALVAGVGVPTGCVAGVGLHALFTSSQLDVYVWPAGLVAAPALIALLVAMLVLYRPLLNAQVVNGWGTKVVRLRDGMIGFAVLWSPLIVGLVLPAALQATTLAESVAICLVFVTLLTGGLEWLRRNRHSPEDQPLLWSDGTLEAYRLRWSGFTFVAVVGGIIFALPDPRYHGGTWSYIAVFAALLAWIAEIWTDFQNLGCRIDLRHKNEPLVIIRDSKLFSSFESRTKRNAFPPAGAHNAQFHPIPTGRLCAPQQHLRDSRDWRRDERSRGIPAKSRERSIPPSIGIDSPPGVRIDEPGESLLFPLP